MDKFIVFCETQEELNAVLEKAENDGYMWDADEKPTKYILYPSQYIYFHPDIKRLLHGEKICSEEESLVISVDKYFDNENAIALDFSQEIKDQIVKEFLEKWTKMSNCYGRSCGNCVLFTDNTKSEYSYCTIFRNDNEGLNELIQIVNRGEVLIKHKMAPAEAIKVLDNVCATGVKNISSEDIPEFFEALRLAREILKEKEDKKNE